MQFIKKDNYLFGGILAFVLPFILFGLIHAVNYALVEFGLTQVVLERKIHLLISLSINLLPIRYYFVNLKFDKTGRGVLFVTFILVILFFALKDKML